MKVVFAGPTLHGIALDPFPSIEFRRPAQCGDVVKAVRDGATVIGLIDGVFEQMPSVWHKEILYALSEGIVVLGAASMGALRAAECHSFGMIGVGEVFEAYASGATEDDEDVAQLHAPAELGYLPLSVPMVDIRATLRHLHAEDRLTEGERNTLLVAARALFFKDRTYRRITETAQLPAPRKAEIAALLQNSGVSIKQADAKRLLAMIETGETPASPNTLSQNWRLARTRSLNELFQYR